MTEQGAIGRSGTRSGVDVSEWAWVGAQVGGGSVAHERGRRDGEPSHGQKRPRLDGAAGALLKRKLREVIEVCKGSGKPFGSHVRALRRHSARPALGTAHVPFEESGGGAGGAAPSGWAADEGRSPRASGARA